MQAELKQGKEEVQRLKAAVLESEAAVLQKERQIVDMKKQMKEERRRAEAPLQMDQAVQADLIQHEDQEVQVLLQTLCIMLGSPYWRRQAVADPVLPHGGNYALALITTVKLQVKECCSAVSSMRHIVYPEAFQTICWLTSKRFVQQHRCASQPVVVFSTLLMQCKGQHV